MLQNGAWRKMYQFWVTTFHDILHLFHAAISTDDRDHLLENGHTLEVILYQNDAIWLIMTTFQA